MNPRQYTYRFNEFRKAVERLEKGLGEELNFFSRLRQYAFYFPRICQQMKGAKDFTYEKFDALILDQIAQFRKGIETGEIGEPFDKGLLERLRKQGLLNNHLKNP